MSRFHEPNPCPRGPFLPNVLAMTTNQTAVAVHQIARPTGFPAATDFAYAETPVPSPGRAPPWSRTCCSRWTRTTAG